MRQAFLAATKIRQPKRDKDGKGPRSKLSRKLHAALTKNHPLRHHRSLAS